MRHITMLPNEKLLTETLTILKILIEFESKVLFASLEGKGRLRKKEGASRRNKEYWEEKLCRFIFLYNKKSA